MFARVLAADFKRARYLHLPLVCAAFGLCVGVVYLLAHDGSWVALPLPDGGWWGFIPDVARGLELAESGFSPADTLACAALAHTVFFPLLVLVVVQRLFFSEVNGGGTCVLFARGVSRPAFFCAKLISISVIAQGCYLVVTCVAFAVLVAIDQSASLAQAAGVLAGRVLLNCLVNESFIAFSLAVFAWMRSAPTAGGIVFVATVAGLVAQLSLPLVDMPVHMAWWIRVCGLDGTPGLALAVTAFSVASFLPLAAAAYVGMARRSTVL